VRRLIVNADDLGRTPGINRGIAECAEHGIVTSASLMVRWPAARDIAAWSRGLPHVSLGLHFDIAECEFRNGEWTVVYCVVDPHNEQTVRAELAYQLDRFVGLVGAPPTHLDSHQHVHRADPVRQAMIEAASALNVTLRSCTPAVRFTGAFYGQSNAGEPCAEHVSVDALLATLRALPEGVTELGCHPGHPAGLRSVYASERAVELRTLCDSRVRAALADERIELVSFREANESRSAP
jgi:predicted glycoside hydrolase/deacetylase ChbG (UPF0249 family)